MVVTGKFRKAPDPSSSCFTVANIHINKECAKRRSVCIALLLLVRDLCLKLGAVVLTGDFNKGAECELSPGGTDDRRRTSPAQGSFYLCQCSLAHFRRHAVVGLDGDSHGNKRPECCGFATLEGCTTSNVWTLYEMGCAGPGRDINTGVAAMLRRILRLLTVDCPKTDKFVHVAAGQQSLTRHLLTWSSTSLPPLLPFFSQHLLTWSCQSLWDRLWHTQHRWSL